MRPGYYADNGEDAVIMSAATARVLGGDRRRGGLSRNMLSAAPGTG